MIHRNKIATQSKPRRVTSLIGASLFGVTLMGLAGCAAPVSGPTTYLLPSSNLASTANQQLGYQQYDQRLAVIVAPLRIAEHLDNEGIVMQLNDIEVYQAREHLWAEGIGQQLQQQLQQRLALALPNAQIVSKGQPSIAGIPVRELRLQVNRFQGQQSGDALAEGQWQLLDGSGQLLKQRSFSVTAPLADNGYPALVRALGQAWQQQADVLAKELALSQR